MLVSAIAPGKLWDLGNVKRPDLPSSHTHTVPGRIIDLSCPVNLLVTLGTKPSLAASSIWILESSFNNEDTAKK